MQLRASAVADSEGMQAKIDVLTARVQELERALQDAQTSTLSPNDPMLEDLPTGLSSPRPSSIGNGSDRESRDSHGERHLSFRICIFQQDLQVHCIWVPPTTRGFLVQPRVQIT
jgi:hypothetical protein